MDRVNRLNRQDSSRVDELEKICAQLCDQVEELMGKVEALSQPKAKPTRKEKREGLAPGQVSITPLVEERLRALMRERQGNLMTEKLVAQPAHAGPLPERLTPTPRGGGD